MPVPGDCNLETNNTWTVITWLRCTDTGDRVSELDMVSMKVLIF